MNKITTGLMSSLTDDWATPSYVFDPLNKEFGFSIDVCASDSNHKCDKYYTKEQDGLKCEWRGNVWCNPPYGKEISPWVKACADYSRGGGIAVCLVPARTDTRWWHEYALRATEIRFVKGRIRFGDSKGAAPFPSAILIFGTRNYPRMTTCEFEG